MKHLLLIISLLLSFEGFTQLSGYWQTENGGCYYVKQDGNEIWWSSQSSGKNQPYNVFHGAVAGNELTGIWCDMPGNPNNVCGESLHLQIETDNRMIKMASSSPYNGNTWTRLPGGCGVWIAIHEHKGCSNYQSFCKSYEIPIRFNSLNQGSVTAVANNKTKMTGTLTGQVFNYSYNAGSQGTGQIIFSPDFKSFTGTFQDTGGHRGIWKGEKK